jgi:DNA-binding HxlR family transcriptional regulator
MTRRSYDQACPVAHSLDLVGERWTLLIVRDLMFGPLRFTDLRDDLPGLAPNLLSDRLSLLVDRGLVDRVARRPGGHSDYVLTGRGRELAPIVHVLARFGVADWDDPDDRPPPPRLVRGALLALMSPELLDDSEWTCRIELADVVVSVAVGPSDGCGPLQRLRLSLDPDDGVRADVLVRTTLGTLLTLRRDGLSVESAIADGHLEVEGRAPARRRLASLLGWSSDPPAVVPASGVGSRVLEQ